MKRSLVDAANACLCVLFTPWALVCVHRETFGRIHVHGHREGLNNSYWQFRRLRRRSRGCGRTVHSDRFFFAVTASGQLYIHAKTDGQARTPTIIGGSGPLMEAICRGGEIARMLEIKVLVIHAPGN